MSKQSEQNQKPKKAVAIKYDHSMIAPKVVASGKGHVAEKIQEIAEEKNISVIEDEKLVEELYRVDIGENIPPELYEVVAQILVFIGDLDRYYKNE